MAAPKQSRLAAAAALRDLLNVFCGHDAPDEVLDRVAASACTLAAEMREGPRWDRQAMLHAGLAATGDVTERRASAFVHRAVAGAANPAALPFDFRRDGEAVAVTVELGPMHEGAPGRAHGGVVAALFDDLTGVVPAMIGALSVTGRLEIDFRSPVPVEAPVELRAWLHERSGRKIEVHADARHAGTLLASARALFVRIDFAGIDTDLGRRAGAGA